ncbi:FAD binding domain-containing protein [Methylobacterium frigidaeris]|uniref:Aldehyde oxidoreductase FAD-binding subunit PaoB n=1 Tax=Methylobacterium frigidaeris TaxID=2038277 RepID=A0AA37M8H1_9HYPH|nr:xanthine dehydrogenase family protein subunit M [Methylobacterium frigidaeris]GJD66683.1 Aldehyde oxidoreductase FAD-binding subunit PaoB [Methylobacterium frigidaeris]
MRPFAYARAGDTPTALSLSGREAAYFAGGTTLLDLMKLDVMAPERLVDINPLKAEHGSIAADGSGLVLGGLARMSEAAEHPAIARDYPAIRDALVQAASAQLRNMASLAGNLLQRTRCLYFRDRSWHACNKRNPGSGCAAIQGVNRRLAVLGVSEHCIAHYPGDLAVALVALDASVDLVVPDGSTRTLPLEVLHRPWGDTPHVETNLAPGELITAIRVPAAPWFRRSLYRKVRDRESYDFALASAAIALDLAPDGTVREARVGLGGLAARPWRAREAEDALRGQRLDEGSAAAAALAAFAGAVTHGENAFKPELGRRTLVRALLDAAAMET